MHIDYLYGCLMEGHLDLMYLPRGAVAWLCSGRPEPQKHAACLLGVEAHNADNPIEQAALLRADRNVLVLTARSGDEFRVYPDGGFGQHGEVLSLSDVAEILGDAGVRGKPLDANPLVEPETLGNLPVLTDDMN